MRAAPLKGDCLICQAPAPTRDAINQAIWPGEGTARSTEYRAEAVRVAKASKVPELSDLNVKTVTRHAEHVEAVWRVIVPGERLRDDEVPVNTDFGSVTDNLARLGQKAVGAIEEVVDTLGPAMFTFYPKETIALAKLGLGGASAREASRLKGNQQVIDVMAIFAAGSGHLPTTGSAHDESEADVEELRAEIATERRQIAARAGEDIPDDVLAAAAGDG